MWPIGELQLPSQNPMAAAAAAQAWWSDVQLQAQQRGAREPVARSLGAPAASALPAAVDASVLFHVASRAALRCARSLDDVLLACDAQAVARLALPPLSAEAQGGGRGPGVGVGVGAGSGGLGTLPADFDERVGLSESPVTMPLAAPASSGRNAALFETGLSGFSMGSSTNSIGFGSTFGGQEPAAARAPAAGPLALAGPPTSVKRSSTPSESLPKRLAQSPFLAAVVPLHQALDKTAPPPAFPVQPSPSASTAVQLPMYFLL